MLYSSKLCAFIFAGPKYRSYLKWISRPFSLGLVQVDVIFRHWLTWKFQDSRDLLVLVAWFSQTHHPSRFSCKSRQLHRTVFIWFEFLTSPLRGVWSRWVCMFVCPFATTNFLCMLPVAMAQSCSDSVAWITSCFHIMALRRFMCIPQWHLACKSYGPPIY